MLFYSPCCAHRLCTAHGTMSGAGGGRTRPFTIDLHCHVLTPEVEQRVAGRDEKQAEPERNLLMQGALSAAYNREVLGPSVAPKLTRIEQRLADMDAMGVDLQVISPAPTQYYYWADHALAADIVALQNEHIAALCAQHPTRLRGLGNVALQHPDLAVQQLTHAVKTLGLAGVEVSSSVNGLELADPKFAPFWQAAEDLQCLVFLHPLGTSAHPRLNRHYLTNIIGQPLETAIALSHLMFGGTLDRHPRLRIVAAHGGGYLPAYWTRAEHAWHARTDVRVMQHPPRDYLRRMWFDSVVYDAALLRHLIDVVGISQVVVGTDYPYDMGDYAVHALIAAVPGLSGAERALVLGGNAASLLGLATR